MKYLPAIIKNDAICYIRGMILPTIGTLGSNSFNLVTTIELEPRNSLRGLKVSVKFSGALIHYHASNRNSTYSQVARTVPQFFLELDFPIRVLLNLVVE